MDTDAVSIYLIESGTAKELILRHFAERERALQARVAAIKALHLDPNTIQVWSSKYDGSMSSVYLPARADLPKGFNASAWTKPDRQGRRSPKRGTDEQRIFRAKECEYTPTERLIAGAYKVPGQINYKTTGGEGSTAIGPMMSACGFLWLDQEKGPWALWVPDTKTIVASAKAQHAKDKAFKITNNIESWKMDTTGLKPILEEEWDLLVAQYKLDRAKAAQAATAVEARANDDRWSLGSWQDAPKGKAELLIYFDTEEEAQLMLDIIAEADPEGVEAGEYSLNEPKNGAA